MILILRLKNTLVYTKNKKIDSDGNMYFTVDSLIYLSNIITGSNNIILRKVTARPCGYDKIYMDLIDLREDKLYQLADQLNERMTGMEGLAR